MSGSKL